PWCSKSRRLGPIWQIHRWTHVKRELPEGRYSPTEWSHGVECRTAVEGRGACGARTQGACGPGRPGADANRVGLPGGERGLRLADRVGPAAARCRAPGDL